MSNNSKYLKNTWYIAAVSTEIEAGQLFRRVFLETPVVMYRKKDGSIAGLHDRCPHRFAPLSMGELDGDDVVCAYHALKFNCEGVCTENPHGEKQIPPKARVAAYTVIERYGFAWIWMGDETPDEDQLPDYRELDEGHENGVARIYMPWPCNYELITDNVMDLSHVDHVHSEIINTHGQLTIQVPNVKKTGDAVGVRWEWKQTPAQLIFKDFLPNPEAEARQFVQVTWEKPANIELKVGASQDPDAVLDYDLKSETVMSQYDLHCCTPEDEDNTHYFFATRRNHIEEDAEYNQIKIDGMHGAFVNEDGPILTAVQNEMESNDFLSLSPALISSDSGPVMVRRLLKKMIKAENSRLNDE